MLKATIMIPTHNHGPTLYYSVGSAQEQTIQDIEIFVIGDGVPDVTRKIMAEFTNQDPRIQFFDYPKGPRYGEIYRNDVLAKAKGEIVCYLSDDSLWLPDHIETMLGLLKHADFAHTLVFYIGTNGNLNPWPNFDFSNPVDRKWAMDRKDWNISIPIALPCAAHTLEMFRKLPYGWRTTPKGLHSDQYMWHQFFAQPGCRFATSTKPTVLIFPDCDRRNWTVEARVAELNQWKQKFAMPDFKEQFLMQVLDAEARARFSEARTLRTSAASTTWRLSRFVSNIPILGKLIRRAARWVAGGLPH